MLVIILPLSASCTSSSEKDHVQTVTDAINELLQTENYSSEWVCFINEEGFGENNEVINSKVFHCPYKLKSEFTEFTPARKELVAIEKYQLEVDGEIEDKFIYYLDDGSAKYVEHDEVVSYEWFFVQVINGLVSVEFISEEIVEEVVVEKFKIYIDPYPFVGYYGLSLDKSDKLTKFFLEEYNNCSGYVYIDTETNCISKFEFDLTDITKINQAHVERAKNEADIQWFVMPDYDKFYISIRFYDINDESAECAKIEKEIVDVMNAG